MIRLDWTWTQVLVGLAMDFTGQAADAVGLVVAKYVLAHPATPSRYPALHLHDRLGQRTATAGRIEVVELAVLQALVGDAQPKGTSGQRHRGAVPVQHEHRLGRDPACDLRPQTAGVSATAIDLHLIAVGDPSGRHGRGGSRVPV